MVNTRQQRAARLTYPISGIAQRGIANAEWSVPLTSINPACCFILARMGKLLNKIITSVRHESAERRVQRLLLGHASGNQMDSAGRLLLANTLRLHAELTKSDAGRSVPTKFWTLG